MPWHDYLTWVSQITLSLLLAAVMVFFGSAFLVAVHRGIKGKNKDRPR